MKNWNWNVITQVWIMIFGVAAVWLVGRADEYQRWGYIFGMCSQPAWFITTYIKKQWGIFILSFFYAFGWMQGFYNYWIR